MGSEEIWIGFVGEVRSGGVMRGSAWEEDWRGNSSCFRFVIDCRLLKCLEFEKGKGSRI